MKPIKVLIIDDSALIRSLLREMIASDPRLEVCGAAEDPYQAREMIKQLNPHVLTLDIEMPRMNGISFLKNLMRLHPLPVVMISTLTQVGAPETLEALSLGAVDFIGKPKQHSDLGLSQYRDEIIRKLICAAGANVTAMEGVGKAKATGLDAVAQSKSLKTGFLCAIGASTGGTEAIKAVVSSLPLNSPPIVVTQHIPPAFSTSFAKRLDGASAVKVYEAQHQQPIEKGCVYIAPGDAHLKVSKTAKGYICLLDSGEMVNRHRPSVEVLFDSVCEQVGNKAMGVILTGMGADGAEALKRMRDAGSHTIAQDEATSIVWGMPGAAVKLDAAAEVLPLNKVAANIIKHALK